jgi:RNA polymerase sigma-70 factor, ECF subfamily
VDGTDTSALALARAGNREAFRALVERHSHAVFRVAYRITRNEEDAEDVVQETFLKAYAELARFEGRAGFGTWVHRIAANCAIDLVRRPPGYAREAGGEDAAPLLARLASPMPGPEREAAGRQIRSRIDQVLAALTPLERAAFTLRHLEQRSVNEISAALGQNPAATRHCIFRAVAKMRRALGPLARTDP